MDPTTAAVIARVAIAVGSSKKVWTGIASVIAALCLPFILIVVCFMSIASGGADHNRAAVRLAFEGGDAGTNMPADYREYISQMQESFARLDAGDYTRFAECFVEYEERTRTIEHEDGSTEEEIYTVAVAVTDKVEIFRNLKDSYGKAATYEQQSNAVNVWYLAKYGTTAPQEGGRV